MLKTARSTKRNARTPNGVASIFGYETITEHLQNNNYIGRFVHEWKPDIIVIEAYWVVPDKFDILQRLHPNVTWVVRNHSSMPFLGLEGVVLHWTLSYSRFSNLYVSCNEARTNPTRPKL